MLSLLFILYVKIYSTCENKWNYFQFHMQNQFHCIHVMFHFTCIYMKFHFHMWNDILNFRKGLLLPLSPWLPCVPPLYPSRASKNIWHATQDTFIAKSANVSFIVSTIIEHGELALFIQLFLQQYNKLTMYACMLTLFGQALRQHYLPI